MQLEAIKKTFLGSGNVSVKALKQEKKLVSVRKGKKTHMAGELRRGSNKTAGMEGRPEIAGPHRLV